MTHLAKTVSIASRTFADAWFALLSDIVHRGEIVKPRGTTTKEILAAKLHVEDMCNNILVHPVRNLNYKFMLAEWLWITSGQSDVKSIAQYNSQIAKFSDNGSDFYGAYGPRMMMNVEQMVKMLEKDKDCRQAVTNIFSARDLYVITKDTPCTLTYQVVIRHKRLHAVVNMRSSDIWLGLPYDFFNFSMLSIMLATRLGVIPGSLTFMLGSSHLYIENSWDAERLLKSSEQLKSLRSPSELKIPVPDGSGGLDSMLTSLDAFFLGHRKSGYLTGYEYKESFPWEHYRRALTASNWADALNLLMEVDNVATNS